MTRNWVETATTTQIDAGTLSDGYGYQWWIDDTGFAMAQGFGGQYIIVIPERTWWWCTRPRWPVRP